MQPLPLARLLTDPDWLDRQYNNRLRVPDAPELLQRWAQASSHARSQLGGSLDLAYGEGAGERLDVFPAAGPALAVGAGQALGVGVGPALGAGAPVLVFIHGGYWRSMDKADHSFLAPAFVQAGACVVLPNYALAPAVTVEHISLQVVRALAWVGRNIGRWGGDARRVAVVGHSAGGHLAAMALSCRWRELDADLPADFAQRAMGISGLYDLEPLRHCPYLQKDLQLTPQTTRRASPAFFPRPKGRFYAVVGLEESDEFLRHNRLIRDAWGPSTVPVCETVPGCNHFNVLHSLADPGGRVHHLALRLLGLA
jgi:arylformamidase